VREDRDGMEPAGLWLRHRRESAGLRRCRHPGRQQRRPEHQLRLRRQRQPAHPRRPRQHRFYSIGGLPVATRTGASSLAYTVGDQQDTEGTAIDATTLAVTRRYFDPYGNTIGATPTAWPGQKGFVDGTTDPGASTGLTQDALARRARRMYRQPAIR
jgi:hypothetical protein